MKPLKLEPSTMSNSWKFNFAVNFFVKVSIIDYVSGLLIVFWSRFGDKYFCKFQILKENLLL